MADSAASAASSGGDAVAHLPRTSLVKDSGSALSRSSAGSAHGVKTFVDKVRGSLVRRCQDQCHDQEQIARAAVCVRMAV